MLNRPIKKEQLDFLDWEFGVFFHFGIRTFYEGHVDWDMKEMPLEGFNPTDLDCDQWIKTIAEAGAKYSVLVCKHHDGFANWPSKYTDYSVKNTPWKNGNGDVVGDYVVASRRYGLKIGLYYSPAQFGSVKMNAEEYDNYFINQISELLTNYGKIDYLWFDGCGSEGHTYDFPRIVKVIRELQPNILIFSMADPDTYWCGNESGYCEMPNFNIRDFEGEPRFLPFECDCRIRSNWFYSDGDKASLKTVDQLMGMYRLSVGRGANLLLNIGPDRAGKIGKDDAMRVIEFGNEIKKQFGYPVKTEINPKIEDGKVSVWFDDFTTVHGVIVKEDVTAENPIKSVKVIGSVHGGEPEIFLASSTTIGHKMIIEFPNFICKRITLELECDGTPVLNEISVL